MRTRDVGGPDVPLSLGGYAVLPEMR